MNYTDLHDKLSKNTNVEHVYVVNDSQSGASLKGSSKFQDLVKVQLNSLDSHPKTIIGTDVLKQKLKLNLGPKKGEDYLSSSLDMSRSFKNPFSPNV